MWSTNWKAGILRRGCSDVSDSARIGMRKESPLFWPAKLKGKTLWVLDETALPSKFRYIKVRNIKQAVDVIRQMKTRAFGQLLVVFNTFLLALNNVGAVYESPLQNKRLYKKLQSIAVALNASRPTFPFAEVTGMVMAWAKDAFFKKEAIKTNLTGNIQRYLEGIRQRRLQRIEKIAALIQDGQRVLTHCNVSGELAMAAQICQEQNKRVCFFATETRPYFQGAKLTCWELKRLGVEVTLVADNAVGNLLANKMVDMVIVGSDRSCANGDIANKIGTYQIAVLAKEFGVPFYALTQPSNAVARGEDIPIELRDADELLKSTGRSIAPRGTAGFYPAFDVVSRDLIQEPIAIDVS